MSSSLEQNNTNLQQILDAVNELPTYDMAYTEGAKSEYDRFWDTFQNYGNRRNYQSGFAGQGWTYETFRPKYDIIPSYCNGMLSITGIEGDLVELLDDCKIKIDLGNAYRLDGTFSYNLYITHFPEIDVRKSGYSAGTENLFSDCQAAETIDKLILPEEGSVNFGHDTFVRCYKLKNLVIEGKIKTITPDWASYFNLHDSTLLSKNSIISVINALSEESSGLTAKFSLNAVSTAFETSAGAADGSTSQEWLALVATKPNWTISLL